MLAAIFEAFGEPDVINIVERPIPSPGAEEVVVKVAASSVNPTDLMMREGRQAAIMTDIKPPFCTGVEFSGYVHSIGSEVVGFAIGQPVMGIVNSRRPAGGAHAAEAACSSPAPPVRLADILSSLRERRV